MKQLHLTISPTFFTGMEDYLLDEQNLSEFFNRIRTIVFNDNCTFYYSPQQQREVLSFLQNIDHVGYQTAFLSLLLSENVEEASSGNMGGIIFQYLGNGYFQEIRQSEAVIAIYDYEMENVALINFSDKRDPEFFQIILDLGGELKQPKKWTVLPTFSAFLKWATQVNPRTFDETMNTKHPSDGKLGFGSSLLCEKEEVYRILQIAFHKKGDHEDHLFFYHLPKNERPILWLKCAGNTFNFHGFHISKQEARNKKLDVEALELYCNYLNSQLTL